ncbi:hypothetical protein BCR34DRAFT_574739 [Clohesyomyces aquaticus]|uniref:Uncharacterized protein n=1 Tax=Clohesyomyces aquaticus TaxID=1231657 RepID=A0A1Y1YU54_9PLEO|nr:hypothetical protein BCR34DRAFT_574739 [Clohesyomyces aquaticus]
MKTLEERIEIVEGFKSAISESPAVMAEVDARIAMWKAEASVVQQGTHKVINDDIPSFHNMPASELLKRPVLRLNNPMTGKSNVLVECKAIQMSLSETRKRINEVSSVLNAAPPGPAVLRAAGYVEDTNKEGTVTRMALLYELPLKYSLALRKLKG